MSEKYIFLGQTNNTFFFLHKSNKNIREISLNIYTTLLNNNYINKQSNLVIYQIGPDNIFMDILCIQDRYKNPLYEFEKEDLYNTYTMFLQQSRESITIIEYKFSEQQYCLTEIKDTNIVLNFPVLKINNLKNMYFSNYKTN